MVVVLLALGLLPMKEASDKLFDSRKGLGAGAVRRRAEGKSDNHVDWRGTG